MFYSARKNQQISQKSEFEYLKEKVEGPFFSAKVEINVSEEFQKLMKKFEKRISIQRPFSIQCQNTEKKTCQKSPIQVKIVNVFTVQKPLNKT